MVREAIRTVGQFEREAIADRYREREEGKHLKQEKATVTVKGVSLIKSRSTTTVELPSLVSGRSLTATDSFVYPVQG